MKRRRKKKSHKNSERKRGNRLPPSKGRIPTEIEGVGFNPVHRLAEIQELGPNLKPLRDSRTRIQRSRLRLKYEFMSLTNRPGANAVRSGSTQAHIESNRGAANSYAYFSYEIEGKIINYK